MNMIPGGISRHKLGVGNVWCVGDPHHTAAPSSERPWVSSNVLSHFVNEINY